MSKAGKLVVIAMLCLLGGCFDVSDEVWWSADGSARLRRTIKLTLTPETVKAKADAILQAAEFARIDIRKDPRVKSFDVTTNVEGGEVTIVADLEVPDAKNLTAVQQWIASKVKVDGATFEWTPVFTFEKLPSGNVKFLAAIGDVKPPASFNQDDARSTFGERVWTLKLYGPSIAMAAPQTAVISAGQVEWKTPLHEVASARIKETELLAEIGPPFPAVAAGVTVGLLLLAIVVLIIIGQLRKQRELEALRPLRAPAPRTMPTVMESGAIPIVASADALLSDASEINVDPADPDPAATPPVVTAQATADAVIKFKCPKCAVELKIPLSLAGRQGKCRKCGGAFVAPVPGQLKQVRAQVAAQPAAQQTPATLRDAFSVKKVKCPCGMTSAILKGRAEGEERCPACNEVLVLA